MTIADPDRGRPLRADAARNRERILAAARAVFAEHGLDASMDDIADRAGVGVGTVYRRFASRDALVAALFDDRMTQVLDDLARALDDPDPWRGLAGFLERLVGAQADDRGLKEVLVSHAYDSEAVTRARGRATEMTETLLERARLAGQVRPDAGASDVALVCFMVGAVADVTRGVRPDAWRRSLALLLDGLRVRSDEPTPAPPPLAPAELDAAMADRPAGRHAARHG